NPSLSAACRVVPEPANGSNTTPLGGVTKVTNHSIKATGLTVGCCTFVPSSRSITGRSFLGAFAWYLNTEKKLEVPFCSSMASAACSSSKTLDGKRPVTVPTTFLPVLGPDILPFSDKTSPVDAPLGLISSPTLHASIFRPPVP